MKLAEQEGGEPKGRATLLYFPRLTAGK